MKTYRVMKDVQLILAGVRIPAGTEIVLEEVMDEAVEPKKELSEEEIGSRIAKQLERMREKEKAERHPCAHNSCSSCHGTGRNEHGFTCVHMISCRCPNCSPSVF